MKLKLTPYVRTAKNIVTANSPILLVGTAVVGIVSTGILAARGGYKARGIIDEERIKREVAAAGQEGVEAAPITTGEHLRLTWLCYWSPAVTALSSCLAVVGVHTIHTKRANAMAAVYAVTANKLDALTEEAEKALGPKKAQDMHNAVGQRAVDENGDPVNSEVILGDGKELCLDETTGRWFMTNVTLIQEANHEINMRLVESGECSLNEAFDYLGLDPIPMGTDFGWSGEKISLKTRSTKTNQGQPALSLWFHPAPKPKLGRS